MQAHIVPFCSILFLFLLPFTFLDAQEVPEPESRNELVDNPSARIEYERIRLADPATGRIPEGIRGRELAFAATIPTRESLQHSEKDRQALALLADWMERGPTNQGGRTRALAIDRMNESVILAGGVSGGMWRSENTGRTWTRVTDPDQIHSVTCVVQDPRPGAGHVWYYGTGEMQGSSSPITGEGLFKSTDGGRSWIATAPKKKSSPQGVDSMFRYVNAVVIDPSNLDGEEVYAACQGGIARSTDGGATWKSVLGDYSNGASSTDVAVTNTGLVYATLSSDAGQVRGIWRSEDGEHWTEITPPNFPEMYGKLSIGIAPAFQDVVYFFGPAYSPGALHTLWYYRYRGSLGAVWENRSSNLPADMNTYNSYCQVLRVSPQHEDVVFLGGVVLYRSTNGFRDPGATLGYMPGLHPDHHEVLFFPSNPNRMLAAHDGGVSLTENGTADAVAWEFRNEGYVTTQFYAIAIDQVVEGSETIIGGAQDNGTWHMGNGQPSAAWSKIGEGDGGFCAIADSGRTQYISSQNGAMQQRLLSDDGTLLGRKNFGPPTSMPRFFFINPFALDPSDEKIMYVPEAHGMWRADNLTADLFDWTKLENAAVPVAAGSISALGLSQANPSHRLYYGTVYGGLYRLDGANTGDPVSRDISDEAFSGEAVSSIAVDPNAGDNALIAISNYNVRSLFHTSDGGETWKDVSGNLEEFPDGSGNGPAVTAVALLTVGGRTLYFAGTTTGLYSTTRLDGPNTRWVQEGASTIGNVWVTMIKARESDGFVAVGTHGRGIFSAYVLSSLEPATVSVTSDNVQFGDVRIGTTRRDTIGLLHQPGSIRDVRARTQALRGPFSIVSGSDEIVLEPGEEGRIILAFSPDSVDLYSDSLLLDHNGTDPQSPIIIQLSGRGTSTSGIVEERTTGSSELIVSGYPNPFAKHVDLHFTLKREEDISLKILALDGTEIATLVEGRMKSGEHNITWTPTDSANGVYYVCLESRRERATVPIVLER